MQNELLALKNLGKTSIHWLHTIGINNVEELKAKGAAHAYTEIKSRGIRVSKVLLYALHGAMTDKHWNDLDDETKQQLVNQAEQLSNPSAQAPQQQPRNQAT